MESPDVQDLACRGADGAFLRPDPAADRDHHARDQAQRRREPVDLNKIVRAVHACRRRPARGGADARRHPHDLRPVRRRDTAELDELSIRTAALLTGEEPEYGKLAARLLAGVIDKEVAGQEIHAFSQSVQRGP
jgi:ribonucleoside-diphosphate reductase alpha chain